MEHAHAAVALMALAAAFAAAAASHAHEEASRAAAGGAAEGGAVHSHVSMGGGRPAVATLTVANAGRIPVVSANATACGASGLLGRAAGDAGWSLRPGAAAAVSWAAPCADGPVAVRVEYTMADGSSAAAVHRACAGGAGSCGPGGGGEANGTGWAAGAVRPARGPPGPAPEAGAAAAAAAPSISTCTVSGLTATVCFNASAGGGGGEEGPPASYTVLRLLVPGPPGYAAVGTAAAPPQGGGGAACHADAAPAGSATAAYRVAAAAEGAESPQPPQQSRTARAYFAAQQCYVDTPDGERIGSPRGPPAPRPAAQSDYRVAMYTGLASTPLTVQAHFGADIHVAERQQDGSWLRLGYDPSHPRGALSDHLPAERIGRGASGDADVRYVRADLLRHLDAFWGARQ